MKVVKQYVKLVTQEEGALGMFKLMEICGRVSWKSEDRITEDSYKKFIKFLYNKGHWAVFNLGTAYLQVPVLENDNEDKINEMETNEDMMPWCKIKYSEDGNTAYITTNYRVLCQLEIEDWVEKYWCDPIPGIHSIRVAVKWKCSRIIAQEILRHKKLAPLAESTRYINYCHDDKGGEVQYILPQYAYQVRDEIAETVDSLTGESKAWIKNLDSEELWEALTVESRWAASRDDSWRRSEQDYRYEILEEGVPNEVARGVLGQDLASEFYTVGWLRDFFYEPPKDSPEQAGFFKLRCAKACHRDLRPMACHLRDLMIEKGYDKIWQI